MPTRLRPDLLHGRQRRWTLAQVEALPDMPGKLRELIDGELFVSPGGTVRHQAVVSELMSILGEFARSLGGTFTIGGPADVIIAPETLVQPDVLISPLNDGHLPASWADLRRPLLVVEVLSPSSVRRDRVTKRKLYAALSVEYWIVNMEARAFERYMPSGEEPDVHTDRIVWTPAGQSESLAVEIPAFFASALHE